MTREHELDEQAEFLYDLFRAVARERGENMMTTKLARIVRRLSFRIAKLAKYLEPDRGVKEEQEFLKKLYASVQWSKRLDKLTDRELVKVIGHHQSFQFGMDTEEDSIIGEVIFRLFRSNLGHTDYDFNVEDNLPIERSAGVASGREGVHDKS